MSGKIEVVDRGKERQLIINGTIQGFSVKHDMLGELRRGYRGKIYRSPFGVPTNPNVLLCGLKAGMIVTLVEQDLHPSAITVIEQDPEIIAIVKKYFLREDLKNVRFLTHSASEELVKLNSLNEKFDLIIDNIFYHPTWINVNQELLLADRCAALLTSNGSIVFHRAIDGRKAEERTRQFISTLVNSGFNVKTIQVLQRWSSKLIFCQPNKLYTRDKLRGSQQYMTEHAL
ncbi:MAG: class I SAM-dependent methyltransferase [Ignavibacteriae bacterium]|nr:class I SAM-dependent methyltransferase [Ignavibacteriota bacterium]